MRLEPAVSVTIDMENAIFDGPIWLKRGSFNVLWQPPMEVGKNHEMFKKSLHVSIKS